MNEQYDGPTPPGGDLHGEEPSHDAPADSSTDTSDKAAVEATVPVAGSSGTAGPSPYPGVFGAGEADPSGSRGAGWADDAEPTRQLVEPTAEWQGRPPQEQDTEEPTRQLSAPAGETAPGQAPDGAYAYGPAGYAPYGYQPGYDPYGWYGYQPPAPPPRSRVSGWVWPVVAVTALVTGLLGGLLGGVIATRDEAAFDGAGAEPLPSVESSPGPLPTDNGSVSAVAAKLLPSTVQVIANGGAGSGEGGASGSGFVVDRSGHVITNNHVVADATGEDALQVVDFAGRSHRARIVGRSPVYDIAVLEIEGGRRLQPAALGSSRSMRVGETVVAIGSPLGLSSTVTSGIVSALNRPVTTGDESESSYINAVQTDAAINPGNSGGPLVNLQGQVVGVNSAIATMSGTFGGDTGNIGVGFAIPMEQVRVTANQILETGRAEYPVIGANVDTGGTQDGAEVVDVPAGTPAAEAGLQEGDRVVAVEGKRVTDGIALIVAIRSHRPGETITLTVLRDGDRREIDVTLDAKVG